MRTKYIQYIMILILTLSILPPVQNILASPTSVPSDSVTTSENVGIQPGVLNPTSDNYIPQRNNPVPNSASQMQSGNRMQMQPRNLNPSHPSPFTSLQASNTQELPSYLSTWATLSSEMTTSGSRSSFSYADSAILHYENKQVEYVLQTVDGKISPNLSSLMIDNGVSMQKSYPNKNYHLISVPLSTMETFVTTASQLSDVIVLEPNFYSKASFIPNDPMYNNQYGPQIIGMETAWDVTFGNRSVLVAVIDTGIDYTHPELVSNYVPLGYDWVNNDNDPMDDHSHGTHVAGTIAASINNGIGIAGIANVSVMAEKFLDASGFGSDIDGANAIYHAVAQGADILSNSWGGSGYSQILADAVKNATDSGVIVVAAAGNSASSSLHYPAGYPGVIGVTATDANDNFASFSNYGDWIDIAAPGVDVLSSVPGNAYAYYSGTSMATPHVSGLLALLMSEFPTYTPVQLEELMYSSAVDLGDPGFDIYFGHGRIDASTAIYGIQDHDVRAELSAPKLVPNGNNYNITFGVTNLGLMNESNVYVELSSDFGSVMNVTIPFVNSGQTYNFDVFYPGQPLGTYNYTVHVDPVINETSLANNDRATTVTVSDPIIFPQTGDKLWYGPDNGTYPFVSGWEILDASNPLAVIISDVYYDPVYGILYGGQYTLNTYTREFSGGWELFPYWINPNVQIGDRIDLFTTGSGQGLVIGDGNYSYYGNNLNVWIVDDGYEIVYFTKDTGTLIRVEDYNGAGFIDSTYNNVHPGLEVHNQLIRLNSILTGSPNQVTNIDLLVFNTGDTVESSSLYFAINGSLVDSGNITLNSGEFATYTFSYTPLDYGRLSVEFFLDYVPGEIYTVDNYISGTMNVVDLQNYNMVEPTYNWYDAQTNGFNLNLNGDDVSTSLDLPFAFDFYDGSFSTVYISSNGWLSFGETNPTAYYPDPIPTASHPYMVAPFFSDLVAQGNVYAWVTTDYVVIQYSDYYYLWGDLLGTFEVVFFANGDILFQYQSMTYQDFNAKGLNYGLNLNYYNILTTDLTGISNYAAKFTLATTTPPPVAVGPDLKASLDVPYPLSPGDTDFVTATVTNIGTTDMNDVFISLYIDGMFVSQMSTPLLAVDDSLSLNYLWIDIAYGNHSLTVDVSEDPTEVNLVNNHVTQDIFVSDEHDLSVWMQITATDNYVILDAMVYNTGYVTEHNVELNIEIDSQLVTFGVIGTLDVGSVSVVSYIWNNPAPGDYNLTAWAPFIFDPELNPYDNVFSTIYTVQLPQADQFVLQLFDGNTTDPIADAYVYLYNPDLDLNINAYTNASGGLTLDLPAGQYSLYIDKQGYQYISDNIVIDGLSYFVYYMQAFQLTEVLNVMVVDGNTSQPVSDAWVWVSGYNGYYTGEYTNSDGFVSFMLPEDTFYIDIRASGFIEYWDNVYVVGEVNYTAYLTPYVIDSQLVIQLYDADTMTPVPYANINIYGSNTGFYDYYFTNESGLASFDVPSDYYNINIDTTGYSHYYDYVYVDGFVYLEIYLTPIVIDAVLAIQVVDANTGASVAYADINVNGWNSGYYDYAQTNSSGYVEFNVPTDHFDVWAYAGGYFDAHIDLDVSNYTFTYLSMTPYSSGNLSLTITSPSDNATTSGSTVLINYDIVADFSPEMIEVYIDGVFVTYTNYANGELLVPVFYGGFQIVELVAYWSMGSASDTIGINVENVQPIMTLQIGDAFTLNGTIYDNILNYNITVVDQLSEFEYYLDFLITYQGNTTQYYLVLNVLNGYVSDSDSNWMYSPFLFTAAMNYLDSSSSLYGLTTYFDWGNVLYPQNIINDNGVDVFEYHTQYDEWIYFRVDNGVFYHLYVANALDLYGYSTLTGNVTPGPEITPLPDQTGEAGTSVVLTWNVTVYTDAYYNISVNGMTVLDNIWFNGSEIQFTLSDNVGSFNVELIVWDANFNFAFDNLTVIMVDTTAPEVSVASNTLEVYDNETAVVDFNVTDINPGTFNVIVNGSDYDIHVNWTTGAFSYEFAVLPAGYYEITFQFLDLYNNGANVTVYVNVLVSDVEAPVVRGSYDFTYEHGAVNNYIIWSVSDESSTSYVVYLDGEEYAFGDVVDGQIELLVDGMDIGRYNFTVFVMDSFGNTAVDEVIVYVIPSPTDGSHATPPGRLDGFTSIYAILGLAGIAFMIRKRYKASL